MASQPPSLRTSACQKAGEKDAAQVPEAELVDDDDNHGVVVEGRGEDSNETTEEELTKEAQGEMEGEAILGTEAAALLADEDEEDEIMTRA